MPLDDRVRALLAEYDDMTIVDIAFHLQAQLEAVRIAIKNERNKRDPATGFIQVLEAIIGEKS